MKLIGATARFVTAEVDLPHLSIEPATEPPAQPGPTPARTPGGSAGTAYAGDHVATVAARAGRGRP